MFNGTMATFREDAGYGDMSFSFLSKTKGGGGEANFTLTGRGGAGDNSYYGQEDGCVEEVQEFTSINHLHSAFATAIFSMPSRLHLFEVMDEWMICIERGLGINRHFDLEIPDEVYNRLKVILKKEYETWDLIKTLYYDRLAEVDEERVPFNQTINDKFRFEDQAYSNVILQGDRALQEMDLIINWLELNYSRQGDPDLTSKAVAWEQTLQHLKRDKMLGRTSGSIVSNIDPDGPTRENKVLNALDADEEIRILRGTFHYLRIGDLDKAVGYLHQSGHIAKAKALLGSLLSQKERSIEGGDENLESENFAVIGNPYRMLWKKVAWSVCEDEGMSKWERAIVGACCGHRKSMLEVANTWEDKLWAYLKTSVNVRVEEKLKNLNPVPSTVKLATEYWSQGLQIDDILNNAETNGKKEFNIDNMFQFLQKCVMKNDVNLFLSELQMNIDSLFQDADHPLILDHLMRFLIHVLLSFAITHLGYNEELMNLTADAYITVLVRNGLFVGIPFYVQKLSQDLQISVVVRRIHSDKHYTAQEIKHFLQGAVENALDVLKISVAIVDKLRDEAREFDVCMLQWISSCFDLVEDQDAVMYEFLRFVVLITRKYLTLGDMERVKSLIKQVTPECIGTVGKSFPNIVREFVCYREYLEADEALALWKQAKSQRPMLDYPVENNFSSISDRALLERRKREFESDEAKWRSAVRHHGKEAIDALMKILTFPDGGWLRECCNPADEDEAIHINAVRRIIMKKVTFLVLNLAIERASEDTFHDFIFVLCDGRRKILEELSPAEVGSIFKVVEEFSRKNNPSLFTMV